MLDVPFRSAKQLAAEIRRKKIGCLELLDHFLGRIEKYNPKINAIVWTDRDGSRVQMSRVLVPVVRELISARRHVRREASRQSGSYTTTVSGNQPGQVRDSTSR